MRRFAWLAGGLVALFAGATLAATIAEGPKVPERDLSRLEGDVGRGAYVARLSGCIGCHTDSKSGGAVLAGGAAIETDFGRFYAPNITPHPEDGIGDWTLDDFAKALTAGESPDGRHYFPSFPYTFYSDMTDQDIVDLWDAVRSVPPVPGGPPAHELRFPFGFHQGVGAWKWLFFDPGQLTPVAERSAAWNRGRYLAQGPAHCGACHTPRNFLGGRETDQRYAGSISPEQENVPPITAEALRSEGWTRDDLTYALRTGIMPDGDTFGGSMAEYIRGTTQFWSDEDLAALAEYLLGQER